MSIRQQYIDSLRAGIEAAEEVIDKWSNGDLAAAVNNLESWKEDAEELIEDWDEEDDDENQ